VDRIIEPTSEAVPQSLLDLAVDDPDYDLAIRVYEPYLALRHCRICPDRKLHRRSRDPTPCLATRVKRNLDGDA